VAKKSPPPAHIAGFIETMECLPVTKLPEGPAWSYEIKLDGYRLEAVRSAGKTTLYSRRQNILNGKFHQVAAELQGLPDDTVLDGELVALGPDGRPDFNLLQNFRSAKARIIYYVFDILVYKNRDLTDFSYRNDEAYCVLLSNVENMFSFQKWRTARQRKCFSL
jgi:ATP-dependent DNA ligase